MTCSNIFTDEHFGEVKTVQEWFRKEKLSERNKEMLMSEDFENKGELLCKCCWSAYLGVTKKIHHIGKKDALPLD